MKIAIVGAGISGLTAARLLHRHHEVTVYEAEDRIGGHTATVDVELDGRNHAVDTGFIVYNDWTYPNFIALMDQLGVSSQPTEMGFSVTTRHNSKNGSGRPFEYCGSSLRSLFADPTQLFNFKFSGMLGDIVRFNWRARRDLARGSIDPSESIGSYIGSRGFGRYFRDYYLNPMASAIWSTPVSGVDDFNALFFLRFYQNHGLLSINNRPQWRVLQGGSRSYLMPLTAPFRDRIRTGQPVRRIERGENSVTVTTADDAAEYDQVILACHSDQALDMLASPSAEEREVLSAIPYRDNSVVLHTDPVLLPVREAAWTSWNYLIDGSESKQPVLTYNMNILQGIQSDRPICVTVNGDAHIDPAQMIQQYRYSHPQFGARSVEAQAARSAINGRNRTWFCGAYWGNGFHEDGVVSALPVAEALGGDRLAVGS